MTIASEISRLQTDKEAMRQAIIDKGVDVAASVSFDDYAACIAAIPSAPKMGFVDFLLVGGGGGGGKTTSGNGGGGGGGGGFLICTNISLQHTDAKSVVVGVGGAYNCDGGNTSFLETIAYGGGHGGYNTPITSFIGGDGASGGGGGNGQVGGCAIHGSQGCRGGQGNSRGTGGGGGGAGGVGGNATTSSGGSGGIGCQSNMSGTNTWYSYGGCGSSGGSSTGGSYNVCGGGGGGGYNATNGKNGIAIVRYKSDGSCGINCATGGTITTTGGYTIHTFTSNGTFTIVS